MFAAPRPPGPAKKPPGSPKGGREGRLSAGGDRQFVGLRAPSSAGPGPEVTGLSRRWQQTGTPAGPARQRALHPGGHPGQPRLVTAHTSFQDAPPSCTSRSPRAAVSLVAAGCPGRSSVWRGPGSADACPPSACPRCAAPGRLLHRSPQPRALSGGVITPSTT